MEADSFYIVLPSNTPVPGNRTSDYLVKFPNIIDLSDGNWTVALSSIVYPLSFSGVEEEQRITIYYENKEPVTILIPKRVQYNSIEELENILNETVITTLFNNRAKKRPKRERPVAKARDLSQRPVAQPRKTVRPTAQIRGESPPPPQVKTIPSPIPGTTTVVRALEPPKHSSIPEPAKTAKDTIIQSDSQQKTDGPKESSTQTIREKVTTTTKPGTQTSTVPSTTPEQASSKQDGPKKSAIQLIRAQVTPATKPVSLASTAPSPEPTVSEPVSKPSKTPPVTLDNRPIAQVRERIKERPTAVQRPAAVQPESEAERSPPIVPLKEQRQKQLDTAKWWINKLIKDIENSKSAFDKMYLSSYLKVEKVRDINIPTSDTDRSNIRNKMFHALYNFEVAKKGVQDDFAEAKKLSDRALNAYEEKDLPVIQEQINFLKNIRRKFNADEGNFKGYETKARKLIDTITDNNNKLSEQRKKNFLLLFQS